MRIALHVAVLAAAAACSKNEPATTTTTTATSASTDKQLPTERNAGALEVVATFSGAMPTGVTVSRNGRVFVNFPQWGDPVDAAVMELVNRRLRPFPSADAQRELVSVQSVVVDPSDRLWIVDTGNPKLEGVIPGAAKLVAVDLATNQIVKTIPMASTARPTSYLNDIRFDLRRGKAGVAFLTDSSSKGPNAIIVVDLDSGRSWRRLEDHPSTKADPFFLPFVEGRELWQQKPGQPRERVAMGADGIAIGREGKTLYYCPLASRRLYAVSADALADEKLPDHDVAKTVQDLGDKGASDGLESDAQGRLFVTSYETGSVLRRNVDGSFDTIAHDPRMMWPDTLSLASDGWLYFTANQLHRQPQYHDGKDERVKPYVLFRVKTDSTPVRLAR